MHVVCDISNRRCADADITCFGVSRVAVAEMVLGHLPATGSAAGFAHVADADDGEPTMLFSGEPIGGVVAGFTLPTLLFLLWTAWNIVGAGHVLRHALSTLFAFGIALAVVYMYIASRLAQVLFFR